MSNSGLHSDQLELTGRPGARNIHKLTVGNSACTLHLQHTECAQVPRSLRIRSGCARKASIAQRDSGSDQIGQANPHPSPSRNAPTAVIRRSRGAVAHERNPIAAKPVRAVHSRCSALATWVTEAHRIPLILLRVPAKSIGIVFARPTHKQCLSKLAWITHVWWCLELAKPARESHLAKQRRAARGNFGVPDRTS